MASRKGRPNKVGAEVKDNILAVFVRLGSTSAMADWARANQTEFYKMYGRLAPTESIIDVIHRDETNLTDDELADIATGRSEGVAEQTSGETIESSVH